MKRVVILGAAGRDFHDFNCLFRNNPEYNVVAFTATQIPDIAGRRYPPELAGTLYPDGIPIVDERDMEFLIRSRQVVASGLAEICGFKSQFSAGVNFGRNGAQWAPSIDTIRLR